MREADLDAELAALRHMDGKALRERWAGVTGKPVPKVSPKLLRLALAWEMQAARHGGLPRRISQRLEQLAGGKSETRQMQAGMRLVRTWNGEVHVVTIGEDKVIAWNNRTWRSLSEVARAITGTRWSGPALSYRTRGFRQFIPC